MKALSSNSPAAALPGSRVHSATYITRQALLTLLRYLLLLVGAVVSLMPLIWMISTSLKQTGLEFAYPPQWIPRPTMWRNYPDALKAAPFGTYFLNSTIITGFATVGATVSSTLVAYGFARLKFRGRDIWFTVLVGTMMLPWIVTLIPSFILFRFLGWYNTFLPLIVPSWAGSGFFIFLVRQYYMSLPYEYEEAARVDGAGTFWIYSRIMLPLSGPAIAAVAIFAFMDNWNDFMGPLIYLQDKALWPLALGLRAFLGGHDQLGGQWNQLMAVSVLVVLPVLVIFFAGQRYFVSGISMSGLAGR
jgi:multiple sugar transport system permease protein